MISVKSNIYRCQKLEKFTLYFYFPLSCFYSFVLQHLVFCCFFHFKFFCMHICLLTTFWVHRYTLSSDSCRYFSMKIVKIAGDVWNAATVLIFLPHKQEQTELLPSSKPFNNYGQRPRLSWKVNCIWNVIWHMDFFGKDGGWRWRVSELCSGT